MLYNQKIYRSSSDNLIGSLPYKQQGLAARATYSWNDRYFFEANLGYNGSENFSPEKRFGFFPAFGLGWAISNEAWWESLQETVSYFKVRYTDGLVWYGCCNRTAFYVPRPDGERRWLSFWRPE